MPVCTHLSQAILWNQQVMFVQDTVLSPHLKRPPHRGGIRSPMLQMRNCSSGKLRSWYRVTDWTVITCQSHVTPAAALPCEAAPFPTWRHPPGLPGRLWPHSSWPARSALLTAPGQYQAARPRSCMAEVPPGEAARKPSPKEGSRLCWRAQVGCGAPHSGGADEGLNPGLPLISCLTFRKLFNLPALSFLVYNIR